MSHLIKRVGQQITATTEKITRHTDKGYESQSLIRYYWPTGKEVSGFVHHVRLATWPATEDGLLHHDNLFLVLRQQILEQILGNEVPSESTLLSDHLQLGELRGGKQESEPVLILAP